MADYPGGQGGTILGSTVPNFQAAARQRQGFSTSYDGTLVPDPATELSGQYQDQPVEPKPFADFAADQDWATGVGPNWFELIHYTPERIDLGNILTTTTQEIEVYNSYRDENQEFTSVINNAGGGITFNNLPTLPVSLAPQTGAIFDVVVDVDGPPTILGTLDFVTAPANFSIPMTGSRVVMFAWEPERPIVETLEFMTDIVLSTDGTEQRIAWRKNPRQKIQMVVRIEEGEQRRKMMTLMKGWHSRVFGVPIWWESRDLQTDVPAGAMNIPIDTDYADYRVGGLVIIWSGPETFDAVEITAVNADSLDLSSSTTIAYTAGEALVMPLRVATTNPEIPVQRFLTSLQEVSLEWLVKDNDVGDSFADTSAFSTHNSKVMLDDPNVADGPIQDDLFRGISVFDSEIGKREQFTDWISDSPITQKGFYGGTREAIWETRRLVHALRGSQVSFYLPTFYYDFIAVEGLASSSPDLRVENTGYVDYLLGKEPFVSIWIELTDGTILTRQIIDGEVVDSQTELLTVDIDWPSDIPLEDIARISQLRLVRISDDSVTFIHDLPGSAQVGMGVKGAS